MQTILSKIFTWTKDEAFQSILATYKNKWCAIVNYLYFANISSKKLFENHTTHLGKQDFQNALLDDYKKHSIASISSLYKRAILDSDFLLPDGIALQIYYALASKLNLIKSDVSKLQNLNWTDFSLDFLHYIKNKFWKENVNILLYWTRPEILVKAQKFLENQGFKILYTQDGYTNINREKVNKEIANKPGEVNILLVARTTPIYPIQEIRSRANQDKVKSNKLLVMNQWGTFDFWAGIQKRAPKIVRRLKLERLRRVMTDPKRNFKKVKDSFALFTYIFTYLLLKKR